ncbi:multidrug efflux system membrane fusion protein [Acidovorax soli]|jgi:multidrug efflux system membrane fusion protein|uniref:Multidrug efflux system membrane fusion protein n=1 Tax=Acidovorax soli TaxID=592050 RepID=A0A7X0UA29_9BURK|nr:efflux RND transporter periplasmic adaptor subunit [Acidovorax soli]MBB6560459.1 multidrug efflux system membrane fusion protein [Acidovorax soli]
MNFHLPFPKRPLGLATLATAAAAVAASAVLVFQSPSAQATAGAAQPQAVPVSVAAVLQQDISLWDEFSGRLEAVQRVDIRARVSGAVQSVHFREGSLVKQGDLLITVDPAPYAAEVDRAEAQVAAAQARVSYTRSELERATRLLQESAIAQREHDERQNAQREADANLRAAQAALQTARLNLGYTQVRAPVAGRVGRIEITQGNLVASGPGAPVLTTLVSVSPIYASFDTDEQVVVKALQDLKSGTSARTLIERIPVQMGTGTSGGTPHAGKLQLIDNQVDAKSGTVRVRAVFDNADGDLIPGQFARIRMGQARSSQAILINERAVGTDQNKKFVLVVGEGNKAEYREVTLGAPIEGLRVVTSGLKAGETIIVNGLQRVRPGAVVAPQSVPMTAKAEIPADRKEARAAKSPAA